MMEDKLREIEHLQQQEQRVYEKFLISLEGQVRQLLPKINQPELLSEMMAEKGQMMEQIQQIESGLSPLRREIGQMSKAGTLTGIDPSVVEHIKTTDLNIIDLITRISRTEQSLTNRIKEHMEMIKERLQQIGNERQIQTKYNSRPNMNIFATTNENIISSSFESAG